MLKMLRILWGIQICMQTRKNFSPLTFAPSPLPKNLASGTGPPVGIFFSKPPHMCVQNDQRDEGIIILGYVCWGTRDHPLGAPNPPKDPPTPPPPGGGDLPEGRDLLLCVHQHAASLWHKSACHGSPLTQMADLLGARALQGWHTPSAWTHPGGQPPDPQGGDQCCFHTRSL